MSSVLIFWLTPCNKTEFKSAENDNGSSLYSSLHVVDQSSKLVQPTLELVTTNSDKTKAKIIWALKFIDSDNDTSVVFKCIFPDSKITSSFQIRLDKFPLG